MPNNKLPKQLKKELKLLLKQFPPTEADFSLYTTRSPLFFCSKTLTCSAILKYIISSNGSITAH